MYKRHCFECGAPIIECMGFILAGDFVRAIKGDIPFTKVRERCGRCVEGKLLLEEGYIRTKRVLGQQ